jgi:hypothetical protein
MKTDLKSGINVQIIDWSKLNEKLSKEKLEAYNKVYNTDYISLGIGINKYGYTGFIDYNNIQMVINNECCSMDFSDNGKITLDVYPRKDEKSIPLIPMGSILLTVDEVKKYLTNESKDLFEFMGNRFNYNDRIIGNIHEHLRLFKKIDVIKELDKIK